MRRAVTGMIGTLALLWLAGPVRAEPPSVGGLELQETFLLGISEHRVDAHTEIQGWRLNRAWYVGRQKGDDSLSLVWQGTHQQVSISTHGIRFTRRF